MEVAMLQLHGGAASPRKKEKYRKLDAKLEVLEENLEQQLIRPTEYVDAAVYVTSI